MHEENILLSLITNRIRLYTIVLLANPENKNVTISDIHKFLLSEGENYDYKSVHNQIKILEKKKVISLNKAKTEEQGRPVYLKLNDIKYYEAIKKLIDLEKSGMSVIPNQLMDKVFLTKKLKKGAEAK